MNVFAQIQLRLNQLKLSNKAVWDREKKREKDGAAVGSPWYTKGAYLVLCLMIDVLYENRPVPRFWFLEMVARMPYFSYISMLHLYESLGWWRAGRICTKASDYQDQSITSQLAFIPSFLTCSCYACGSLSITQAHFAPTLRWCRLV